MTHKPQAPYTLAVKTHGPAKAMYESYPTLREAEKQATWHIDHVNRAQIVIADATGAPVRIHNGNRLEKIEGKHIPAEKMIEEAHTMTHEHLFADDFEITQDQADTLNARIAADKEGAALPEWIKEALQNWKETRPEEYAAMAKRLHNEKQAADKETPTMQYRALNATELKQYVHEHPEFITCPKCEGKAYSDGTENPLGWRVMCCTCNGIGLVTPKEEADAINARIAAGEEYAELYGDINEHRAEPTGEEAPTMQTTTTTNEERRLTLGLKPKLTKKEQKEYDQLTAAHDLAQLIQPGDTVYVIQRHVSRSGMKRILSVYASGNAPDGKARLRNITFSTAHALQWKLQDHGGRRGIVVNGCGMDMHFHTVYTLARVLFGDGYALTHETL